MSPTNGPAVEKLEKTYKVFDLETMTSKSVEVKTEFSPAANVQDALGRFGGNETAITSALNAYLRRSALAVARANAVVGASKSLVMNTIRPFRDFPNFAAMLVKNAEGKVTPESRAAQTKAILEMFKSSPALVEALKAAAAAQTDDDEDSSDDE